MKWYLFCTFHNNVAQNQSRHMTITTMVIVVDYSQETSGEKAASVGNDMLSGISETVRGYNLLTPIVGAVHSDRQTAAFHQWILKIEVRSSARKCIRASLCVSPRDPPMFPRTATFSRYLPPSRILSRVRRVPQSFQSKIRLNYRHQAQFCFEACTLLTRATLGTEVPNYLRRSPDSLGRGVNKGISILVLVLYV